MTRVAAVDSCNSTCLPPPESRGLPPQEIFFCANVACLLQGTKSRSPLKVTPLT